MNATHWRVGGRYACGVGRRWASQDITSTTGRARVTCRGCRRSRTWRGIPTIITR